MIAAVAQRERLALTAKALLSLRPEGDIPYDSPWAKAVREIGRAWVDSHDQSWFFYKSAGYLEKVFQLRAVFEIESSQWERPEDSFWDVS